MTCSTRNRASESKFALYEFGPQRINAPLSLTMAHKCQNMVTNLGKKDINENGGNVKWEYKMKKLSGDQVYGVCLARKARNGIWRRLKNFLKLISCSTCWTAGCKFGDSCLIPSSHFPFSLTMSMNWTLCPCISWTISLLTELKNFLKT